MMASRNADIQMVRSSLRWYAFHYVAANAMIAELRKNRGLQIPEVEFSHLLDGARTVRTALQQAGMDGEGAARCLWALASIGALAFTVEPPDMSTVKRRAVAMSRQHLRARRGHVGNRTYYDVLEVTRDATPEEVDDAARMLSVRYSPDRLAAIDLGDCEQLVDQTWKEIYEAHRVLRDEQTRYRYDVAMSTHDELETTWGAEVYDRETAEVFFNRGQQALVDGEPYAAVSNIAAAARNHPDHPDYETTLAWARYRADVDRGDARDEVAQRERAAAEKLTMGRRPWPRGLVALGLLCAADGDSEAARWWLREALTCDPSLPAARQLLSRLQRRA
jgi:hypothetical protein